MLPCPLPGASLALVCAKDTLPVKPRSAGTWSSLTLGESCLWAAQAFPDHPLFCHFAAISPGHRKIHCSHPQPSRRTTRPEETSRLFSCLPSTCPGPGAFTPSQVTPSKAQLADKMGFLRTHISFQGPARCLWTADPLVVHLCTPEGWAVSPPWGTTSWPLPPPTWLFSGVSSPAAAATTRERSLHSDQPPQQ